MKKLALVTLALAASLSAADYSGVWKGKGGFESAKYGSVPATAQMTLVQAGSSLSGTLRIGNGALIKLTNGTVSGNQITFAVGPSGTGSLTVSGNQMSGKLTSSTGNVLDIIFSKN